MGQQTKAESRLNCRKLRLEGIHYVSYSQIYIKKWPLVPQEISFEKRKQNSLHLLKPFKQKYQTFIFATLFWRQWDLYANIQRKKKQTKKLVITMRTPTPALHSQKTFESFLVEYKMFYPLQTIIKYDYYQQH